MAASALTLIMTQIYAEIPIQILEAAFLKEDQPTTSLDERIIHEVIRKRVLLDANLVATRMCRIPLCDAWVVPTSYGNNVGATTYLYNCTYIQIPPEAREFRNIASVIRLTGYINQQGVGALGSIAGWLPGGNTVSSMASAVVGSHTLAGAAYFPLPILQDNNLIRITGVYPNSVMNYWLLECTLENDEEFTNVGQNMEAYLKKLGLAATKQYIHTNLVIPIGETQVVGGMDIGVFKEKVESYANAGEEYDHYLDLLRGAQVFDPNTFAQFAYYSI